MEVKQSHQVAVAVLAQAILKAEWSEARGLHPGRRLLHIYVFILIAYIL